MEQSLLVRPRSRRANKDTAGVGWVLLGAVAACNGLSGCEGISRRMRASDGVVRRVASLPPHPRREKKIEMAVFAHVAPSDKQSLWMKLAGEDGRDTGGGPASGARRWGQNGAEWS